MKFYRVFLFLLMVFLISCSRAYEKVKKIDINNPKTFEEHLLYNYKKNASFEAKEMHDWNSAKLYSEKALQALNGKKIYPEKISYWKIPQNKISEIKSSYDNLISVYQQSLTKDPKNLAKAISSLDCWAEQEEEKWQTWDIERCKNDFHNAMHGIYKSLSNEINQNKEKQKSLNNNKKIENRVSIVTQNEKREVVQIIYFDFDNFTLSQISLNVLKNFLNKNKKTLSKYIIVGHTDTKGSNNYNQRLSFKRADAIKKILINEGILEKNITLLGKGEEELAVNTPNDTKHPANRRAEVKLLN